MLKHKRAKACEFLEPNLDTQEKRNMEQGGNYIIQVILL